MREDEEEYLSGDFFDTGEDVVLFPSRTMECIQEDRPRLGPQRSPGRGRDGGQMQSRGVKGVIAPDPVPAESDDPDGDDFLGVRASRACLFPFFFFFDSLSSTLVALSFLLLFTLSFSRCFCWLEMVCMTL